jgi:hypothetical protein
MRHTQKPGTRRDSVGAQHVEDPPRWTAPAEDPFCSFPRETTGASPGSFGLLLGGRSFSSDIRLALSSGVLTPEAGYSALPLQVSNA